MSPRPGPARRLTALRLSDAALERIDALAAAQGRTRSEQLRVMLAFAERKMPAGWTPKP